MHDELLRVSKSAASRHDFDEYARLVDVAKTGPLTYLGVLVGGDAHIMFWPGAGRVNRRKTR